MITDHYLFRAHVNYWDTDIFLKFLAESLEEAGKIWAYQSGVQEKHICPNG